MFWKKSYGKSVFLEKNRQYFDISVFCNPVRPLRWYEKRNKKIKDLILHKLIEFTFEPNFTIHSKLGFGKSKSCTISLIL